MLNKKLKRLRHRFRAMGKRRIVVRVAIVALVQIVALGYLTYDYVAGEQDSRQFDTYSLGRQPEFMLNKIVENFRFGEADSEKTAPTLAGLEYLYQPKPREIEEPKKLEYEKCVTQIVKDFQVGFTDEEIDRISHVILKESQRYGYDPRLLIAVILTESSLRKGQSYQGAHGLMQIKPIAAVEAAQRRGLAWHGETSLFDPAYNIKLGSTYLFDLIMKYGDIKKGLVAYSFGEAAMRNRLETNTDLPNEYASKVMARFRELLSKYPIA